MRMVFSCSAVVTLSTQARHFGMESGNTIIRSTPTGSSSGIATIPSHAVYRSRNRVFQSHATFAHLVPNTMFNDGEATVLRDHTEETGERKRLFEPLRASESNATEARKESLSIFGASSPILNVLPPLSSPSPPHVSSLFATAS